MNFTSDPGFSEAAKTINRVMDDESRRRGLTVTFSNAPLHDQLIDVFKYCSKPGWDGEDALAVQRRTLSMALELVEALPANYRTPEITGEPDGEVNLEWYKNPRRLLSVSISADGLLRWAALIGEEDPRGSCRFHGEAPKTLLYWIGRVCAE